MSNDELMHHGILGMKWGVRRYQNKDGSLTYAGKKRALKMQDQYTELSNNKKYHDKEGNLTYAGRKKALKMKDKYSKLTGGKQLRKYPPVNQKKSGNSAKKKTISEMSNKEIQERIDRIRLENTLNALEPQKVSKGKKFAKAMSNVAVSIAKDKLVNIAGDYLDKKLRTKLKLNEKSKSQKLKEEAQNYINRQTIDRGQQYFKEGKYAEKKSKQDKTTSKSEAPWTGTVEGVGTSSRKKSYNDSSTKSSYYSDPIDVEWREVNSSNVKKGQSYINGLLSENTQFLLEDKSRRRR